MEAQKEESHEAMEANEEESSSSSEEESSSDEDESMQEEEEEDEQAAEAAAKDAKNSNGNPTEVYLPNKQMEAGEELVVDESAYRMLHQAQTGAPCLSFDLIQDDLGNARETYPMSMYMLAGTQAPRAHVNNLLVIKIANLSGTKFGGKSDEESSEDEDEDEARTPVMSVAPIKHQGCVNRVRCTQLGNTTLAASWSELGRVNLWNLNEQLTALNSSNLTAYKKKYDKSDDAIKPIYSFKGHLSEGYGLDWCSTEVGTLATGDCKGNIHIWRCGDDGGNKSWIVDQRPYSSHAPHSVEDLQWSPNERHVLASCSVDKSIKIWDTRVSPQSACMLTAVDAHSSDVNVISWNRKETQFLLSGGDDGAVKVWDLRHFTADGASPVATFKQHTAPVTTVEWHPQEATVFASGGADDQICQWDLSVEADDGEASKADKDIAKLPPQLLFIHQGQTDVKELHWHAQCTGTIVSTALSGFNMFRTISV